MLFTNICNSLQILFLFWGFLGVHLPAHSRLFESISEILLFIFGGLAYFPGTTLNWTNFRLSFRSSEVPLGLCLCLRFLPCNQTSWSVLSALGTAVAQHRQAICRALSRVRLLPLTCHESHHDLPSQSAYIQCRL